uniref:ORF 97 protein n=1 Tax=Synechocystis TaxID=1142 RepID=Q57138_9SYNC|nr:ORF 97 [Synechocystis]BAA00889.1 unnamed protein product [Synechocystis sp. PCC 6803]
MQEELSVLLKAQYPLIYLVTSEEERAEQAVYRIVQEVTRHQRLFVWTVTHGFREYGVANRKPTTIPSPLRRRLSGWCARNRAFSFSKTSILSSRLRR